MAASATVHYVDLNSTNPTPPYTGWSTAATNIQDAADAASAGDEILVTNGVYQTGELSVDGTTTNRVAIDIAVTVQSVNGAAATAIDGGGVVRCVSLASGASLIGFTLTNGASSWDGGGAWCSDTAATLLNCTLINNSAVDNGGGADSGSLSNCTLIGNTAAGGAGGAAVGNLTNCTLVGNSGNIGGAAWGAILDFCTLSNNYATFGGGVYDCEISHSTISSNATYFYPGAAYLSELNDCLVVSNTDSQFSLGGLYGCLANNCLMVGNSGYGAYSCNLNNCIVYYNEENVGACYVTNSCTIPLAAGVDNFTNEPMFVNLAAGDFHLQSNSPCINVGNNSLVTTTTDLDGNPRIVAGEVDLGPYEYQTFIPMDVSIATDTNVVAGYPLLLQTVTQRGYAAVGDWDFGDGTTASNQLSVLHSWSTPGNYLVTLWAYNAGGAGASGTITVHVSGQSSYYVDARSTNPVPPFNSSSTAATNLQDAVDLAPAGATVYVANGTYSSSGRSLDGITTNSIVVTTPITIQSANGPATTTITGGGTMRCVYLAGGATLSGFTISGGFTPGNGGGVSCDSTNDNVADCIVAGNSASVSGGGAFGGTLFGSALVNNHATNSGGGAEDSLLNNCSLTANTAGVQGGGADASTLNSCIAFFNTSPNGTNYFNSILNYCDTSPLPTNGIDNILSDPEMTDNVHISPVSSCRGAGEPVLMPDPDIDGQPWLNPPSIGCDEYYPGATGSLTVTCSVDFTNGAVGYPANFTAFIGGHAAINVWNFGDGTVVSNSLALSHIWTNTGLYTVTLTAYNDSFPNGVSATVQILIQANLIYFVNPYNPSPVAPYRSWATAAQDIPTAVGAAALPGSVVLVTNASFANPPYYTISITNPVIVRSVNGPSVTSISGSSYDAAGCVYLVDGASLDGFTLSGGLDQYGGGVYCESTNCTVANCIISGCDAFFYGGGAYSGTLSNCVISGGNVGIYSAGGGAYGSVLINCVIANNTSQSLNGSGGAGAYACTLFNCTVVGNSGAGGIENCVANYCSISRNNNFGAYSSTLNNCVIYGNNFPFSGASASSSTLNNCILFNNSGAAESCILNNSLVCSNNSSWNTYAAVDSSTLTNCTVIYNNAGGASASVLANCIVDFNAASNYLGSSLNYCCAMPLPPAGIGNIAANPQLLPDGVHLSASSPCRVAGNFAFVSGVDIDGQPWLNPPSIGCAEFYSNAFPAASILTTYTNVLVGYPLNLQGILTGGQPFFLSWNFGDNTVPGAALETSHAWSSPGDYVVTLTAYFPNTPITATATLLIHVLSTDIPVIETQPANQTITAGNSAQFNIVATGSPLLTYQWQFDGTNLNGATNTTLELFNVQTNQAGDYSVIVTDPICDPPGQITSSNALLTVNPAVCVTPPPGLVSWWRAEGNTFDSVGTNEGQGQNISYAPGMVGEAFAFNDGASSISVPASATLNIGTAAGITIECWIQPDAFDVSGAGPVIEWDSSATKGVQCWAGSNLFANIMDTAGNSHTLQSTTGLLVTNEWQLVALTYDTNSGAAVLYLNGNVVASNNFGYLAPQTSYTVNIGQSVTQNGPTNSYGGLIDELSIYDRALSQAEIVGIYTSAGAEKCDVPVAPTILAQPTNTSVLPGNNAGFNVVAAGSSPLSYQWLVNNAILAGATNSTLTLNNVDYSEQSNLYSVTISNAGGSLTSSNAELVVIDTPPHISSISNQGISYSVATLTTGFTVTDAESSASSLVVTGSSSNTNLVPNNQIVFNGTDSNRTVTLTAISNQLGNTAITLTVTDPGGMTASNSFVFSVTNATPQISSIPTQGGPLSAPLVIPFTVSDVETPASQLIVTAQSANNSIVPTNQMVLSGSGTNRTLTILPGTNSAGATRVTLTVTDALGASNSTSFTVQVEQFTQFAALGLTNLIYSAAAWGDYDNDGKLDLLVTGSTNFNGLPSGAITRIYHNDGGVFTNFISLPGVCHASVAWCDYNHDGFLDFAICGLNSSNVPVTMIYHNNGDGTFTNISANFVGVAYGSLAWGDFNNDGAPDLFVSGVADVSTETNISKLYRNNGDGTFADMKANLPAVSFGSAVWGDFDNNGTADLLLVGLTNFQAGIGIESIYLNQGNGVFTATNSSHFVASPPASFNGICAVAGDLNNDGWLDIVISIGPSTFVSGSTLVFTNNQNRTFTRTASLGASSGPSLTLGDMDNDGYLDLVVTGNPSQLYHNNHNGTFTAISSSPATLPRTEFGSVAVGDFNNDDRLDLVFAGLSDATLWQNDTVTTDTPPIAPGSLAAINLQSNSVILTWSPSVDSQAPTNGVTYNLRVGTNSRGIDTVPPMADPVTGQRRVAAQGNAGLTNQALLIDLPKGTYYWAVQAIDNAYEGSPFSAEGSFVITNSRPTISAITDQVTAPFSPLTVPFSISDADTPASELVVTAQSSNTNIVPLVNIVLSVPNPAFPSNYLAQITPVTNGASTITITVSAPQGAFASTLFSLTAAQFTLLSSNFTQLDQSFVASADFDNDGNLDFLISGMTNGNAVTQLYRNLGGGAFIPVSSGLPTVDFGSAAWGDFDNSGNLGLVLTGTTNNSYTGAMTRIYRNTGGTFTDIGAGLPGLYDSAVAWGDFDNDGRLDLLVTGTTNASASGATAQLYRNMGNGTFSNAFTFPGVYVSAVAFADFDGDGFADIVIAGENAAGVATAAIYRNNGGKSFTLMTNLTGVDFCSVSVGDFDNDGRPDILLSGFVYRNLGNFNFTNIGAGLPIVQYGSVAWGDVDNDGLSDILICGAGGATFTRVYHNSGSATLSQSFTNFSLYSVALATNYEGAAVWGDFENRGVLDVLISGAVPPSLHSQTLLFRNNCVISNTPPSAPTGLTYTRSNTTVLLAWNPSSDLQTTNASGLNYQVRIGTTSGGIDIKSPPADPLTGHRRLVQTGDTFTTHSLIVGLPPGTYYWSVQAIDTGFAGSPFAAESTFTVLPPPIAIPDAISTASNTPISFAATNLTTNDIDLSGLPLAVTSVGTNSASGGTVSLASGTVTYTPPVNFNGNDTFWYSISDGQSATAVGTVTVTVGTGGMVWLQVLSGPAVESGNFEFALAGVPGLTYTIEAAGSVTGPWTKLENVEAPQTDEGFGVGGFEVIDPVNGTNQFYRVIYPAY